MFISFYENVKKVEMNEGENAMRGERGVYFVFIYAYNNFINLNYEIIYKKYISF